uniref:Putative secreted protein n=1 Tax=Anopheles darlingi TaxID=43151 RepID=A0A2M4D0Z1_ANODA
MRITSLSTVRWILWLACSRIATTSLYTRSPSTFWMLRLNGMKWKTNMMPRKYLIPASTVSQDGTLKLTITSP